MGQEDKKQRDESLPTEMSLEYFVPRHAVCGIPAEGIEAVYWNNELLWEKSQK